MSKEDYFESLYLQQRGRRTEHERVPRGGDRRPAGAHDSDARVPRQPGRHAALPLPAATSAAGCCRRAEASTSITRSSRASLRQSSRIAPEHPAVRPRVHPAATVSTSRPTPVFCDAVDELPQSAAPAPDASRRSGLVAAAMGGVSGLPRAAGDLRDRTVSRRLAARRSRASALARRTRTSNVGRGRRPAEETKRSVSGAGRKRRPRATRR